MLVTLFIHYHNDKAFSREVTTCEEAMAFAHEIGLDRLDKIVLTDLSHYPTDETLVDTCDRDKTRSVKPAI